MIKYLRGICGYDRVPLSYVAQPTSDLMPIADADNPSNTYGTYEKEIIKRVPIIEPGHASNETEEDEPFYDTFIGDRGKVWYLIYPLLHVTDAWPHVNISSNNCDSWKSMLDFYDHCWGQTTWITYRSRQIRSLRTLHTQGKWRTITLSSLWLRKSTRTLS